MERIKEFFLTDIRLLNGYVLIIISLLFLILVSFSSYALFVSEQISQNNIEIIVG